MTLFIPGANITAQWYGNEYPGVYMDPLEKYLLHSTETLSWPGYSGGASAPTFTYHPRLRQIRQHFDVDRSARALRDPAGTPVRENRDGVVQVEIVAYSDAALARRVDGLWIGDLTDEHMEDLGRVHLWLNQVRGMSLRTDVRWAPGTTTAAGVAGLRLTSAQYDAAKGLIAHMHASGNEHWDVGGFDVNRYYRALQRLNQPEDDMATPQEIWDHDIPNRVTGAKSDADDILSGTHKDTWDTKKAVEALTEKVDQILARLPAPPT